MEELIKNFETGRMQLKLPSWASTQHALTRKKGMHFPAEDSKLVRVLTTLDLTALGVGSTLGVGVYVLAGDVAKNTAGPAVTISFFIAAVASVLAGLCYAEFGARVPKAGSAYVYSYVCIGEFFAFVIGWNLILEYLIGSATVTKALFLYIDDLANNTMSNFFEENIPMDGGEVGTYADIFSLGLSLIFSVALAFGAKESSLINNICTLVNISVVILVIVSGFWKVNASNWTLSKNEVKGNGEGGFAPFGIQGVIKGAARCFFGFIGFDCIATAGEEAKTPQKSIPIGVVMSLLIVFLAYFGISTVITMMVPYYFFEDNKAPLSQVYDMLGWTVIKDIVSVGAMCGLFASLLGAMFPLPRIIYAMASDGLLFKPLSKVHPKFHTPFMGTLIAGAITGVLACLFELKKLTDMMSIGTLLAYSMVAACVMILRFSVDETQEIIKEKITLKKYVFQLFNKKSKVPTRITSTLVSWLMFIFFCFSFVLSALMVIYEDDFYNGEPWLLSVCAVLFVFLIILLLSISFQPRSKNNLTFQVPLLPWIPGLSILINIYLMTNIQSDTWEKYGYWMAIGLLIYFCYGIWNSSERCSAKKRNSLNVSNRSVKITQNVENESHSRRTSSE